jgi:hypothetical protein
MFTRFDGRVNDMKRSRYLGAALALWAVSLFFAPSAAASAGGEALRAVISEAVVGEAGVDFTLEVSAAGLYEDCSAVEFALVSSDRTDLFIRPLEGEDLDITFAGDLGGVYHRGRDGAEPGSVSYLVGHYVKDGANDISGDRALCRIGLRYEGSAPRQIRLEQISRVRTDEADVVVSEPVSSVLTLDVDPGVFETLTETATDGAPPLAVPPAADTGPWPLIAGALAVLLAAAVAVIAVLSKRRPAGPAPPADAA